MEFIKKNLKPIIITTLLLVGLIIGVYLAQTQQIFRSKAGAEGFIITASDGSEVQFEGNNTFSTTSESVTIGIQDLERLK